MICVCVIDCLSIKNEEHPVEQCASSPGFAVIDCSNSTQVIMNHIADERREAVERMVRAVGFDGLHFLPTTSAGTLDLNLLQSLGQVKQSSSRVKQQ